MLIQVESGDPAQTTVERVRAACAAEGFGVLGEIDLRAKLHEKGHPIGRSCVVLEVCRPDVAQQVLERAPEVSSLLPCRISVYEVEPGRTLVATARPRDLLVAAGVGEAAGVAEAADEVEAALRRILDASA